MAALSRLKSRRRRRVPPAVERVPLHQARCQLGTEDGDLLGIHLPGIAARQMDVSAAVAGKVYDELLDNYSRDGRFDPEGLRVLVDSLVEMGALRSADVSALYTEDYLQSR